jgi:hypothetical protein
VESGVFSYGYFLQHTTPSFICDYLHFYRGSFEERVHASAGPRVRASAASSGLLRVSPQSPQLHTLTALLQLLTITSSPLSTYANPLLKHPKART